MFIFDDDEVGDTETHEIRRELSEIKVCIIDKAMTTLPPVKCFREDQMKESQSDCCICLEEFKNGDFIQPFGVCIHEFHSLCINYWVHSGNISCPLCRKKMPILL
ncbi:hypothetical protein LR48_Vigan09g267700 [Vigna angularis]|uniref:RING-type E3 ubiquitin transferase n=1 Tax=Phaseolus angularis TaxID=3914 RepID=A0A0L9VGA0_PHAAN|nr:hypothetical protein LR48_Vigan09g267700 [Vigna angularis]